MLKCYNSSRFSYHYYCYLDNDIFLIKDSIVNLVDKEDYMTNYVKDKAKSTEITNMGLLIQLKYLINKYLLNAIEDYSNKINHCKELHKQLNEV